MQPLSKQSSFTLLELTVVIAVLGLIIGIVLPNYSGIVEKELEKSESRTLAGFLKTLQSEALFGKKILKIVIDKEGGKIETFECVPKTFIVCEWEKTKTKLNLKLSSKIKTVIVDGEEAFGGTVEVIFSPAEPSPFIEIQVDEIFVILNPFTQDVIFSEERI